MDDYSVIIQGESVDDDGFRLEITVDPSNWWSNLQRGTCPDCGGDWVWFEGGYVPGTRKCVGKPVGHNPTVAEPIPQYDPDGGCGSFFTVLGSQYDPDAGEDARRRNVAVLRRERMY